MARITDMGLREGVPKTLRHPIVGQVGWGEINGPGSGYCLYYLSGPEQGQALTADWVVLYDDQWFDPETGWDEYDRLCRLKEKAVANRDFEVAAQYREKAEDLKKTLGPR